MGIADIYEFTQPDVFSNYIALFEFDTSYYSISLALNVLLTLMIIMRLVLHNRNVQNAIGAPAATSRTYKAIITMLVESFAVYAIAFLVFIALHVTNTNGVTIFSAITSMVQVRIAFAFFLPTVVFQHCFLIMADRLLLRSSSFCESPTGGR